VDVTQAKDRAAVAAGIGDKKRVLTKLRDLLDNAQGVPAEQVMLRTADLLGKSVGLYKDVQVQEQQTSEGVYGPCLLWLTKRTSLVV